MNLRREHAFDISKIDGNLGLVVASGLRTAMRHGNLEIDRPLAMSHLAINDF